MKKLVKIVRISSKEWFKKLRDKWPIYCKAIDEKFMVSNLFLRHISWNATKRSIMEIIERLSIINLVEKIWSTWNLLEVRENILIEKNNYRKSFKIWLTIKKVDFSIILAQRIDEKVVLISAFVNFKKNKKIVLGSDPSLSIAYS